MTCPTCTAPLPPDSRFCAHCGATTTAPPPPHWSPYTAQPAGYPGYAPLYAEEQRTRVGNNLQSLGILWCLFGAYRLLAGLLALTAFHAVVRDRMFGDVSPFVSDSFSAFLPVIAIVVIAMSAFSILVGLSLLARRPWARTIAIVAGILALLKLPIGTALGIYTLWVLAPRAAGEEWNRIHRA